MSPTPAPPSPAAVETRDVNLSDWHETLAATREEGFTFFDWLSAVDQTDHANDGDDPGFDLVCHLLAVPSGIAPAPGEVDAGPLPAPGLRRVLLRTRVPEGGAVASGTDLWRGAAWHERETHEMFGINFTGFEDGTGQGLRPLLLPDGFEGAPLRKSFVLAARVSKPWPGAKDPGESEDSLHDGPRRRRRMQPPGLPDPSWGPRGHAEDR